MHTFPGGKLSNAQRIREQFDSGTAKPERASRQTLVNRRCKLQLSNTRADHITRNPQELHQVEEKVPKPKQQTDHGDQRAVTVTY